MNTEHYKDIKVWDIGVRLFHWSLVAAFITSYLSKELHELHTWSGYAVIALLGFRLIWGFSGGRYARFSHFSYSPAEVMHYLKGLARGKPPHYTGHNPAGGWMIYLLLFSLTLVCFSGLKALAIEGDGPFAALRFNLIATAYAHGDEHHEKKPPPRESVKRLAPQETPGVEAAAAAVNASSTMAKESAEPGEEDFWNNSHKLLVNLMLLLIGIHVLGVAVSGWLHRENLVRAMITGNKRQGIQRD